MKLLTLILILAASFSTFAKGNHHGKHKENNPSTNADSGQTSNSPTSAPTKNRQHGAHVHGTGSLGIAFEKNIGKLDFKAPSESIFEFEHSAQTEADKKTMKEGLERLEAKIADMVVFDPTLGCQISKEKIQIHRNKNDKQDGIIRESEHSETLAVFNIECRKLPAGTTITFNFQKYFPRLKDLDVSVLADALQKSVEVKKDGTQLELK